MCLIPLAFLIHKNHTFWDTELEGLGSNPIRHSRVSRAVGSAPTQSEFAMGSMGRLGPQIEFHPLYGCAGESIALES